MDVPVKQEPLDYDKPAQTNQNGDVPNRLPVICLTSSDSDSEPDSDDEANVRGVLSRLGKRSGALDAVEGKLSMKRMKLDELGVVLPDGFLDPLPQPEALPAPEPTSKIVAEKRPSALSMDRGAQSCKQFWKAGDYEGGPSGDWETYSSGMDHVRVHPKFLHSNATSHKWALGAFAELLDNALDEVCNGATYVNVDVQKNIKDGSRMLLIEDNGGGMDPDRMRQCMSLGYSAKSKVANTIGQYGNGFKTSTMRLGADVIVFSRCHGKNGKSPTQSIGLLSYTFLRGTGKEDIVVPMLDYELRGRECSKMIRTTVYDWDRNAETILQWSPFSSEADLIRQFDMLKDHGTRIFIYNLWEDDQGLLELDFDADPHDIQVRGVNRDEKNIQKAEQFPNSKHFLTYRHSLKSYVSILYLRLPPGFRIILRGKDVEHHNIVNDMMLTQEVTYRPQPQPGADGVPKDTNMLAVVTIGFVKDARHHIDVQGFNVYHKNRLIKPFWRLWNAAGSDGRGVIGVLEANFVEPAHDKQGFERTTVLARLEARLVQMQKTYWSTYCDKIGYAARRSKKHSSETSPDHLPSTSGKFKNKGGSASKFPSRWNAKHGGKGSERSLSCASDGLYQNGHLSGMKGSATKSQFTGSSSEQSYYSDEDDMIGDTAQVVSHGKSIARKSSGKYGSLTALQSKEDNINQLMEENHELKARLKKREDEIVKETLQELQDERERCKSLEMQLNEARRKVEELNKEQESLIDIFSEERDRRDIEEENLRNKLKEASNTIQELLDKVRLLEKLKSPTCKTER